MAAFLSVRFRFSSASPDARLAIQAGPLRFLRNAAALDGQHLRPSFQEWFNHSYEQLYRLLCALPNIAARRTMIESPERLRVLIANERDERLARVTILVEQLGHEIVARSLEVKDVGRLSRETDAEVALVGLGLDSRHALDLIASVVHEAACPVIALLDAEDRAYVDEAAKRGVFAYVVMDGSEELQSALDITLRRFAELSNLQGAFGRRAIIEQAKGILMARNGINAEQAFQLLKAHSQQTGRKLVEVADAVTRSHQLLGPPSSTGSL